MSGYALLTGKIGDLQRRTTQAGTPWVTFSLTFQVPIPKAGAVHRTWRCSAFGDQAEEIAALGDGALASVSGALQLGIWTSPDGQAREAYQLLVESLAPLKPKPRDPSRRPAPATGPGRPADAQAPHAGPDDDIPF